MADTFPCYLRSMLVEISLQDARLEETQRNLKRALDGRWNGCVFYGRNVRKPAMRFFLKTGGRGVVFAHVFAEISKLSF